MRTARQAFHAAMADGDRRAGMPLGSLIGCNDATDWHSSYCDAGTAAIESRDREWVEAAATLAEDGCASMVGGHECTATRTAARIRALLPTKDPSRG